MDPLDGLRIDVDQQRRFALVDWGAIEPTMPRAVALIERLLADPAFRSEFGILGDHRQLTAPPSTTYIDALLDHLRRLQTSGRYVGPIAVLTPPQRTAVYGMARMTELKADVPPLAGRIAAFTDFDAAVAWLTIGARAPGR